ncbi:hypothetical protein [uncultured Dokdonia sp.]|uniref:hypothetical protein n=1 Tax=uncultured Dokdonia sp. TaxID=575653 RepID=UPI0026179DB3|nr:hypothetical protein [uncultured Dokdonia sp.]
MNKQALTYLLENPENISSSQTTEIRGLIDEFPYFQSAHALYIKGLKNQESFAYNKALKITAAHTTDRSVLFEYITSDIFIQNEISTQIKEQETHLRALHVDGLQDISLQLQEEKQEKATKILDPNLFVEKENSEITKRSPKEILSVGKPLDFNQNEVHSFQEWLQLSRFSPIKRETPLEKTASKETTLTHESTEKTSPSQQAAIQDTDLIVKKRKQDIIDFFIESNPKIEFSPTTAPPKKNLSKESLIPSESLMTETLARVYVEQKNFKKAKQAYRILSLKYPEKSGFFADQIRAVEQLEEK